MLRWNLARFAACAILATVMFVSHGVANARSIDVAAADDIFWNLAAQSSRVVISTGDTVVWTNTGVSFHNVFADDKSWNSSNMLPGDKYRRVFRTPGEFPYRCTLHEAEEMFGIISVQAPVIGTPRNRIVLPSTRP